MPAHQALYRHLQLHNPDVIYMDCHAHVSHKDGTWRMSYWVQLPDTIEAENSVHALDPNASVRRHQEAKTLIPRLVQHTHIRPILEEQPSNYTNASQRGIDPASVYHLVDIEFKDAYLNRLTNNA